jgi:hypothetical protein
MSGYPLHSDDHINDVNSFCRELEKSRDDLIASVLNLAEIKCNNRDIVEKLRKIAAKYNAVRDGLIRNKMP